ncbi:MAG: hypothetical protein Q8P22_01030 [Chloroflexota bacterium]|nr:hypothetical protein [Chloroflexota bacterium]
MSRPRSITYERRVSIFLDYRRQRKIYPIAKRYGIARSTVKVIVGEFKEMGFATAPRPSLPPAILAQAQTHHLGEVLEELRKPHTLRLEQPTQNVRAGLAPDGALSDKATEKVAERNPLPLGELLACHLKGTETEKTLQEVARGIRDYDLQCLALWLDIRSSLEKASKEQGSNLAVSSRHSPGKRKQTPHIPHTLVDLLYGQLFAAAAHLGHPPANWPEWVQDKNDPAVLLADHTDAAVGGPDEHDAVKKATKAFVEEKFGELQRRAANLNQLYRDLEYVRRIVEGVMAAVTKEVVQRGICPACPYPEAREEPSPQERQEQH